MRIVKQQVGPGTYSVEVTEYDATREQSTDTDATIYQGDLEVVMLDQKGRLQKPPEDPAESLRRSQRQAIAYLFVGAGLAAAAQAFTAWATGLDRKIEAQQIRAGIERVLSSPPTDQEKTDTIPGNKIPDNFVWTKSE